LSEENPSRRFSEAALPHLDAAFNLARWISRNDHDAQDIVQEAFLRAFRAFSTFRGGSAKPWLLAIVRNTSFTWLSRHRRADLEVAYDEDIHGGEEDPSGSTDGNPEAIVARAEDARIVNEVLAELPVGYREVLVLRDIEGLSYKEIAQVAGLPIGTVMSRIARGRKLFVTRFTTRRDGGHDGLR
jgi:RNA polymerase sigma-70 factor (ECF subfamily)